jgi:general secretion pathway protein D
MHIKVEISSVVRTESIAGVDQPVIGQRVDEADIRMKDGEVSMLGGLSTDSDSQSIAGIPGVANLPVLGYLFGTRNKDREKNDILVALIPHIIRAPTAGDTNAEGVFAGSEQAVRVQRRREVITPTLSLPPAPGTPPPATPPPAQAPPAANTPPPPRPDQSQALPPTQNPQLPQSATPVTVSPAAPVRPPNP